MKKIQKRLQFSTIFLLCIIIGIGSSVSLSDTVFELNTRPNSSEITPTTYACTVIPNGISGRNYGGSWSTASNEKYIVVVYEATREPNSPYYSGCSIYMRVYSKNNSWGVTQTLLPLSESSTTKNAIYYFDPDLTIVNNTAWIVYSMRYSNDGISEAEQIRLLEYDLESSSKLNTYNITVIDSNMKHQNPRIITQNETSLFIAWETTSSSYTTGLDMDIFATHFNPVSKTFSYSGEVCSVANTETDKNIDLVRVNDTCAIIAWSTTSAAEGVGPDWDIVGRLWNGTHYSLPFLINNAADSTHDLQVDLINIGTEVFAAWSAQNPISPQSNLLISNSSGDFSSWTTMAILVQSAWLPSMNENPCLMSTNIWQNQMLTQPILECWWDSNATYFTGKNFTGNYQDSAKVILKSVFNFQTRTWENNSLAFNTNSTNNLPYMMSDYDSRTNYTLYYTHPHAIHYDNMTLALCNFDEMAGLSLSGFSEGARIVGYCLDNAIPTISNLNWTQLPFQRLNNYEWKEQTGINLSITYKAYDENAQFMSSVYLKINETWESNSTIKIITPFTGAYVNGTWVPKIRLAKNYENSPNYTIYMYMGYLTWNEPLKTNTSIQLTLTDEFGGSVNSAVIIGPTLETIPPGNFELTALDWFFGVIFELVYTVILAIVFKREEEDRLKSSVIEMGFKPLLVSGFIVILYGALTFYLPYDAFIDWCLNSSIPLFWSLPSLIFTKVQETLLAGVFGFLFLLIPVLSFAAMMSDKKGAGCLLFLLTAGISVGMFFYLWSIVGGWYSIWNALLIFIIMEIINFAISRIWRLIRSK